MILRVAGVARSQANDVFRECPNPLCLSFLYVFLFSLLHGTRRASGRSNDHFKSTTNLIWASKHAYDSISVSVAQGGFEKKLKNFYPRFLGRFSGISPYGRRHPNALGSQGTGAVLPVQEKRNPRTGEIKPWYRGERLPPQGRIDLTPRRRTYRRGKVLGASA